MKKKVDPIEIEYRQVEVVSEEEAQEKVNKAFDILFEAVHKNVNIKVIK